MNPITHFLASWMVANIRKDLSRRDMLLITMAGVAPDIDGLGAVVEMATINSSHPLLWWTEYHHSLHNIGFCMAICALSTLLADRKWLTALLAVLAFHLHLLCDLLGAGGPDGYDWPIPYLMPFSNAWQLTWAGQWQLNAWPNIAITLALLLATFRLAWVRGYSSVCLVSKRADAAFISTIRVRFPYKHAAQEKAGG